MTKLILAVVVFFVVLFVLKRLFGGASVGPAEARDRVASGQAILVDVREPGEWAGGVAAPALLLPLSNLRGDRGAWNAALEANKGKEVIVYCASGMRSGIVASMLQKEGIKASNMGGFGAWRGAGLPVRTP